MFKQMHNLDIIISYGAQNLQSSQYEWRSYLNSTK